MRVAIAISVLSGLPISASPIGKRTVDNTQPSGTNPIMKFSARYLGFQTAGTSLVEVDSATARGAIFYLVNANSAGLKGAGVGKVQVINGIPTVTQRLDYTGKGHW
jgi:hypothetical protein